MSANAAERTHRWLACAAMAVALLGLLPVGYTIQQAVAVGGHQAIALLVRPRVGTLLLNTVELLVSATLASVALGTAAAWLVERTDLPARRVWAVLLAVPIAVPAFVRGYAWVSILPSAQGLNGAVLVVTMSYYPLVFLPVRAALRTVDPSLEEVCRSLGLGPWRTFARACLPQIRPMLLGGALLVALDLLAEFGAFSLLRFSTLTTAIYDQYRVAFDSAAASLLALVLIALCALLLGAERALRGRAPVFRVGSGVARPAEPVALGRKTVPALAAVLAVVAVALGVPLGSVGYWLLRDGSSALDPVGLASASATTFALGITVAGVTVLLALPVALLAVRHRGHAATLVERATYLAHALPGIAVALALAAVSIRLAPALYQTAVLLIIGYSILFLPRALSSVRAALEKAPPSVEEAARALGHRPLAVLWRVTIPLVAPGIGAGAALGFLSVITELTTTLLLAPIGTQTLATRVWSHTSRLAYQAAAPYAALMVAVSVPATLLLTRRLATLGRVGTT